MLPPSVFKAVALDMLGACKTWEYPPGPQLTYLLEELLEADLASVGCSQKLSGT